MKKLYLANISDEDIQIQLSNGRKFLFKPQIIEEIKVNSKKEFDELYSKLLEFKFDDGTFKFVNANFSKDVADEFRKKIEQLSDKELIKEYKFWNKLNKEKPLFTKNNRFKIDYCEYILIKEVLEERKLNIVKRGDYVSIFMKTLKDKCKDIEWPTFKYLEEFTGISERTWRKKFKDKVFLKALEKEIDKMCKMQKSKQSKELWVKRLEKINNLIEKVRCSKDALNRKTIEYNDNKKYNNPNSGSIYADLEEAIEEDINR